MIKPGSGPVLPRIPSFAREAAPVAPDELARSIQSVWGDAVPVETVQPSQAAMVRALELAGENGEVVVAGSLCLTGVEPGCAGHGREGIERERQSIPARAKE